MSKHLLIVDDDVIMNNSIKSVLCDRYRVSQLTAGEQVMDFLRKKSVDLVLLDLHLRDISGEEVLRRLKQDVLTRDIPVIIITGDDSDEAETLCLRLGAADHIRKPIGRRVLEQRVENHLMASESYRHVRQMYEDAAREAGENREIIRHDGLTGLWSRRHVIEMFDAIVDGGDGQCAMALIDMDNFKYINDVYGHLEGDELLKRFARILAEVERSGAVCSRIGGDEFLVLLPGCSTPGTIQALSDRVFEKASRQALPSAEPGTVTFSMGVAFCPQDGSTFEQTMTHADMALRKAKSLGKNRVYFARDLAMLGHQREFDVESRVQPLELILRGRRSDGSVLVLQFGEFRILYSALRAMPAEISERTHAVLFVLDGEKSTPLESSRLTRALSAGLPGMIAVAKYAQNQILGMSYGITRSELQLLAEKILSDGEYGEVTVETV